MGIKSYILTIVSTVLFSSLTESLMPDGKMKKHISLVVGLVIMVAITKPLLNIQKFLVEDITYKLEISAGETSSLINEKITNAQYKAIDDTFEKSLSDSLESSVLKSLGIEKEIEAEAHNGQITRIVVHGEESEQVKMYIKQNFGLDCEFTDDGG